MEAIGIAGPLRMHPLARQRLLTIPVTATDEHATGGESGLILHVLAALLFQAF